MDQATRSDMIDLIMQWQFPKRKLFKNVITSFMINVGAGSKKPHSSTYAYVEQSEEYKRELLTKSSEELAELHQQALAEQEREDQSRLDKLASFANDARASANFSRWGRAAYWTSAEATALSLGKDPRVVNWQAFVSRRAAGSTLAGQYHDRLFLLQRALPQQSDRPLIYIEWGKKLGIEFPPELEEVAVAYQGAHLEAATAPDQEPVVPGEPVLMVASPMRKNNKRGRPPKHTPECEAAARQIVANMKSSSNPSDKTDTALIEAFQEWHKKEYPDKSIPVRETVRSWLSSWGL